MSEIKIQAKNRNKDIKAKDILKNSRIPWVIYWPKSEDVAIDVDYQEFRKALSKAKKWRIIKVDVEWKEFEVLIKNYDLDPIYDTIAHFDLIAIDEKTPVIAEIPLELYGKSDAVRLWWVLRQVMDSVKVKAIPWKLPESFKLDVSRLEHFKAVLKVSDMEVEEWVTVLSTPELIVASIIVPRSVAAAAAKSETEESE